MHIAIPSAHVQSMTECSPVPYTYNSVAFVWLTILGLFALTASGLVASPWVLALTLAALAVPFLILRERRAVGSGHHIASR
jgi:hypothetical protein